MYDWDFRPFVAYASAFATGAWTAFLLGTISSVIGSLLGIGWGIVLRTPLGGVAILLNDFVRAIPILVLMIFFYVFPYVALFGIDPPSAFYAALLALSLSQAAFTADLVRSAVDNVSPISVDGARSLGLREFAVWRFVIIPDITRQLLPPLMAFFIANIKSSSLASAIGVHEVVFVARLATGTTARNLEAWVIVALIYVALVLPLGWISRHLENSSWLKRR